MLWHVNLITLEDDFIDIYSSAFITKWKLSHHKESKSFNFVKKKKILFCWVMARADTKHFLLTSSLILDPNPVLDPDDFGYLDFRIRIMSNWSDQEIRGKYSTK